MPLVSSWLSCAPAFGAIQINNCQSFFCLVWQLFIWVGRKIIFYGFFLKLFFCVSFLFAWFDQKIQRLLLGCFLFWEENPKAEAFWLGLTVLCLGWPENDFWVLFKTILLCFDFSYAWFFLHWFLGSFPNYSSAFFFFHLLGLAEKPKGSCLVVFSSERKTQRPKLFGLVSQFFAWVGQKMIYGFFSLLSFYVFFFHLIVLAEKPKGCCLVCPLFSLTWFLGLTVIWRPKKIVFFLCSSGLFDCGWLLFFFCNTKASIFLHLLSFFCIMMTFGRTKG